MPLPYEALRTFLAVVRAGSFSRAARALGVSQPSVSQRVAQLEAYLGRGDDPLPLLERRRGGAVPTAHGRRLCDLAADPLAALDRLENAFEGGRGPLDGRVRVAAADTMFLSLLPDALLEFRRRHPGVRVETCTTTSPGGVAQVLAGEVDFAVGDPGESVPARVRFEAVRTSERLLVVPRGDPLLRLPAPVRAPQLRGRDWVVLPETSQTRRRLDALLGRYPIAMEVEHWDVMKAYVALGMGIGLMPDLCLVPQDRTRLRTIPLGPEFGRSRFGVVVRRKRVLSPAAQALIDVIRPGLAHRLLP